MIRPLDRVRDRLDGLEVTGRGDRKAGLDHVHAEAGELLRDLDLLLGVQRDPGRLLAVAQGRIEDVDPVLLRDRTAYTAYVTHRLPPSPKTVDDLFVSSRLSRRPALFPPRGRRRRSARLSSRCVIEVLGGLAHRCRRAKLASRPVT
jgi:hypothetical protein